MRENAGKDEAKRMKQENICGRKKRKRTGDTERIIVKDGDFGDSITE